VGKDLEDQINRLDELEQIPEEDDED